MKMRVKSTQLAAWVPDLAWLRLPLVALLLQACGITPLESPPLRRFDYNYDPLYAAVVEIGSSCPTFGADLMQMLGDGHLGWGSSQPYGESSIGWYGTIRMNDAYYATPDDIEMLVADIFHEAGHALNNEADQTNNYADPWGRQNLNYTSYDGAYRSSTCPYY